MKNFLLTLAFVAMLPLCASADFIVTIGNGTGLVNPIVTTAGATGVIVPVFVSSTTVGGDLIDGFNLGLDIGGDGLGFTSDITGISILAVPPATVTPLTTSASAVLAFGAPNVNWDRRANVTFGSTQTITGPVHVFDLLFDISNAATPGTVALNFLPNAQMPTTTSRLVGVGALAFGSPNNGSLQIDAVPEPTSLGIMGIAGIGSVVTWRKRRKAAKPT